MKIKNLIMTAFLALTVGSSAVVYADEAPVVWDYHLTLAQIIMNEGRPILVPVAATVVADWDDCLRQAQLVNVEPTGFLAFCVPFKATVVEASE